MRDLGHVHALLAFDRPLQPLEEAMRAQAVPFEVFATAGSEAVSRIEPRPNGRWAIERTDGERLLVGGVVMWGITRCEQLAPLERGVVECTDQHPYLVAGVLPPRHRNLYVVDDRVLLDVPRFRDQLARELVHLMRIQSGMAHALGVVLAPIGVRPRAWSTMGGQLAMVQARLIAPIASRFERFLSSLPARP